MDLGGIFWLIYICNNKVYHVLLVPYEPFLCMIQTVNLPVSNQKAYDSAISSIITGNYPYNRK